LAPPSLQFALQRFQSTLEFQQHDLRTCSSHPQFEFRTTFSESGKGQIDPSELRSVHSNKAPRDLMREAAWRGWQQPSHFELSPIHSKIIEAGSWGSIRRSRVLFVIECSFHYNLNLKLFFFCVCSVWVALLHWIWLWIHDPDDECAAMLKKSWSEGWCAAGELGVSDAGPGLLSRDWTQL